MAKQIIVLESTQKNRLRAAFWLSVPVTRQSFYSTSASAFKNATAGELTALSTGAVTEQVGEFVVDGLTANQIRTLLAADFTRRQNEVNAYNPWSRYGTAWDGTTWTNAGAT